MQEDWIHRINQTTTLYLDNFGKLTDEQLNWKPEVNTWSIGQIIQHVNMLNEDYFKIFSDLKNGTLKVPILVNSASVAIFFGNMLLSTIEPERKKKTKTMKLWEPDQTLITSKMIGKFELNQQQLARFIQELSDEFSTKVIIHSPVSKWIPIPLKTAFEMLIQHELRHFNQAKKILGELEKSALDVVQHR